MVNILDGMPNLSILEGLDDLPRYALRKVWFSITRCRYRMLNKGCYQRLHENELR